jgi:hypothetical protein
MVFRASVLSVLFGLLWGCGGGSGGPAAPATPVPTPAPTPTPEPAGTIVFLEATLPEGATVTVDPLNENGQQVLGLRFSALVTMNEDLAGALVRAWVRTEVERCMGGGLAGVDFQAGVAEEVMPASMSSDGHCGLPYTTTHVEFEVIAPGGESILQQQFPMTFHFVAAQ